MDPNDLMGNRVKGRLREANGSGLEPEAMSSAGSSLGRDLLLGAAGFFGLLIGFGLIGPYRLEIERPRAYVPNLPSEWEGERIALLCDFHVGQPGANTSTMRRAVELAVAERPAALLLAGDFVHGSREAVEGLRELLEPVVRSDVPAFAVLGNHDFAMPTTKGDADRRLAESVERTLESLGITVLHNEGVTLTSPVGGAPLTLVGIDSYTAGDGDPPAALSGLDEGEARVVFMHHPASYAECPPRSAPFAIAGHTHGGQVRLPFSPLMRYITYIKEAEVVVAGWVEDSHIDGFGQSGNRLYISRGVGCSVVPLRLFCPPELTFFELSGRPEAVVG